MIIRPVCTREFVALPNAILSDERLSIETRGMLAYIISKPKSWQIRPIPLARALSKAGSRLGRTKLRRMFEEAQAAGYMARSAEQTHKENGDFGSYVYVIGMPDDVLAAVKSAERKPSVTSLAQSRFAHTHGAHTQDAHTQNVHRIHKRQSLEKQSSINTDDDKYDPPPLPSSRVAAPQAATDECYTALGRNALANGMVFVFEGSRPFIAWREFRGADGMPLIDVAVIGGRRRRGCWFSSMYPPQQRRSA
jgi:hypothetical protein